MLHKRVSKSMSEPESSPACPLTGIAVIEIGHSVAGPYAGQVLADLGATVVKIENPNGGDDARHWIPPQWHGSSAVFQTLNRNKYSACVDFKDPDGKRRARELIAQSDIVIQNMRPGLVERCGLDAKTLRADNPRLIYCNLGAFGSVGPMRESTGYDPLVQAFSGIMSVTGEADRPPVRVGPSIIDMGSGLWCVIGILAALARRQQTGEGSTVDTSLFETGLAWMNIPLATSMASGRETGKSGSETPMLAPYRAFRASDRYIVIAAGNDNLFRRMCTAVDKPEWATDPRFITNADRVNNRILINGLLDEVIVTRPEQYWTEKLTAVGVPCAPLQTTAEVIAHAQTQALGMLKPVGDSEMDLVGSPLSFNGVRPRIRSLAPTLGADTHRALDLIGSRRRWKDL
jgi:crotonobetainyl-CoA:carnitine CoA-transferase CaiB-like acyl-CoA transferase